MADLIAVAGGIVILVSFGKLCIAAYRYFTKRFEVRKRDDKNEMGS